ncbi:hypothetical protein JCM11641_001580 [Rhodosporidiobolus odoratus]
MPSLAQPATPNNRRNTILALCFYHIHSCYQTYDHLEHSPYAPEQNPWQGTPAFLAPVLIFEYTQKQPAFTREGATLEMVKPLLQQILITHAILHDYSDSQNPKLLDWVSLGYERSKQELAKLPFSSPAWRDDIQDLLEMSASAIEYIRNYGP